MKNILTVFLTGILSVIILQTSASGQERIPLYRYVAPVSKNDVYAATEEHRAFYKQKGYKEINVVGYINRTQQPGTTALYHLQKKDGKGGNEHFYTASFEKALAKQNSEGGVWIIDQLMKGVVGYVPTSPGTETKSVFAFLNSDGANIYAFSEAEVNGFTGKGMKNTGAAFSVYKSAASTTDLQIGAATKITDNSVTFKLRSISGDFEGLLNVIVQAIDAKGKKSWGQSQTIPVSLKSGTPSEVTYQMLSNRSLTGQKFQVTIDGSPLIIETKMDNNTSKIFEGPPLNVNSVPPVIIANPFPVSSIDVTLRKAVYFTDGKSQKISTQSPYATPEQVLTLKKSQGTNCDAVGCNFNLGFFAQRPKGEGEFSTYAMLFNQGGGSVGNTVKFAAAERSKDVIHSLKLKFGENKIKVEIDPFQKTVEMDEKNNSFEVTIIVQ